MPFCSLQSHALPLFQCHDFNEGSDRYGDSAIFGVGNETHTLNFGNFILSLIMIKSPGLFRSVRP